MNKLIKIEMERAFKNKMLIISVVIGLVIVGFNIWNEIIPARKTLDKLLEMGKYSGIQLPGLYMKWMGVRPGSYVFLYYFIMPLLTALPYSISILMDVKKHYVNNIFTRIDKKKYYKAKLFAQFIVGGFVASFPLVISFVVTAMILPAFKPESVSSQFNFSKLSVFGDLFFKAPFAMAVIVFLFAFVGFGLINCIAYIFADLVNNRFMVALTPFMIYFFYYIVCSSIGRDGPMEYLTASKLRYSELKFMIIDMVMLIVLITISYFVRSRRIALVCILAGVAAFYIVKVNKMYPQGSVTEYELNEPVELNGYSASVSSYKVMSIEDFLNEYGIDKRKDISDEQDDLYVMVAECTLDITGEMKGFPYADIRLASGAFSQGISNDYIRDINKEVNFSKFEQGTSITVDIPFLIHSISFPHSINADKLNKEEWQLYFSVTPGKYVRMGK